MIKDERVMSIINILSIEKAIDECRCPEPMFCTIATTCTTCHERERACLKCWLKYCKDNNIEIDYEEEDFDRRYCHKTYEDDCLDYMKCKECPYYYEDED